MIRAHSEEYSMPEVERQYLDRYLTNQKQTISPESKPEDFFARFCIASNSENQRPKHGRKGGRVRQWPL